jgi:hypothetical protein
VSRRRLLGAIALVAIGVLVAGVAWLSIPQTLLPEATAALRSTDTVSFTDESGWLTFRPTDRDPDLGLIVYPGARVPAAGYAPTAAAIASAGYLVVVVPMPLNLAILDSDAAGRVISAHPEIRRWALAGHSLGGAMAGGYSAAHPGSIAGIAFWAAYPNGSLATEPIPATVIYGTLDAGAARFTSVETRSTLPADTTFVPIEGGNHEQMGWYSGQPNDPPATIPRAEQQRQLVAATVAVLERVAGP